MPEVHKAVAVRRRPLGRSSTSLLLAGLLGLPAAGAAGTGRLLSQWMSRAPRIDGQIEAGEWSAAKLVDLGSGVTVRIGNDRRTLYFALLDTGDTTHGDGDRVYLHFEDEGGVAPILDDDAFGNPVCQLTPNLGEGMLRFDDDPYVGYFESAQVACAQQFVSDRVSFLSVARPEGVNYEAAIPLDGPVALRASPGERFGLLIRHIRNNTLVTCLPGCADLNPGSFRNLILASGGCNTGPQDFGSGDPPIGLPLDWTGEILLGSGQGWIQSLPPFYGDAVFCQSNDTGGAGAAACVANALATSPRTDSLLRMPLPLAGQASATVRLRALLVVDPNGQGENDLLSVDARLQDGTLDTELYWAGFDQSGAVALPLDLGGSPPIEIWIRHTVFSAGGLEGGFAQVDEVELLCGPTLFADGFESGLTTHWSATTP